MNQLIQKKNKLIDFINAKEGFSSFAFNEKGDLLLLDDKNRNKYKWLNEKEQTNIEYPINFQNIKIINLSANYNVCYAIGQNGNLYKIKNQKYKSIFPPNNNQKFLQCVCGDEYIICLVQNDKGKGILYSKGKNDKYQCGVGPNFNSNEKIKNLTRCKVDDNLDFKYICTCKGFSAAITACGKLYIWGFKLVGNSKSPMLINQNDRVSFLADNVSLNYDYLYVTGRELINGNYNNPHIILITKRINWVILYLIFP